MIKVCWNHLEEIKLPLLVTFKCDLLSIHCDYCAYWTAVVLGSLADPSFDIYIYDIMIIGRSLLLSDCPQVAHPWSRHFPSLQPQWVSSVSFNKEKNKRKKIMRVVDVLIVSIVIVLIIITITTTITTKTMLTLRSPHPPTCPPSSSLRKEWRPHSRCRRSSWSAWLWWRWQWCQDDGKSDDHGG